MAISTLTASPDYKLYCRGALANPYPLFAQLRAEAPIHWSEPLSSWVVTRYDDVTTKLRDPRLASDRVAANMAPLSESQQITAQPLREHVSNWLGFTDPPKHTRLRRLIGNVFTPALAENLRGRITEITNSLLDKAEARGGMDIISDLALPLPATIICEILGIELERQEQFIRWSQDVAAFAGGAGPTLRLVADKANQSQAELTRYFADLAEQRRREPRQDMLTDLALYREDNHYLTEQELSGLCVFLFSAGHETSASLISNAMYTFLENPSEFTRLAEDESLSGTAVEEALRYESPLQMIARLVNQDFEWHGRSIQQGQQVILAVGAANRDSTQFVEPERFDIGRKNNKHLAFGWGIHFCLGAPLARLEGQIALTALARRFPHIRSQNHDHDWLQDHSLRRLTALPVIL